MEYGNEELDTGSLIEMSAVFVRKRVIVESHHSIFNLICVKNMFESVNYPTFKKGRLESMKLSGFISYTQCVATLIYILLIGNSQSSRDG